MINKRNVRGTHNQNLQDPEIAAAYLNDALESGDPAIILMALRNVVDSQEDGISGLAERANLGRESMYKMLSSKGNPKLATFSSVLSGMGFQLQVIPEVSRHAGEGDSSHLNIS